MQKVDLLVIGGGINGSGVARDAAGRGLKVILCEKDDLAQATSSSSTKLIHGGLRYLEFLHFKLVRESLREREILLNSMPHIIWPLRFILPHHKGLRPIWLLRLGLFIYDHIGGRKLLPSTKTINLKKHLAGVPLKDKFSVGFEYSDCWVEDSRMVVLNAIDAKNNNAEILTHTSFIGAKRRNNIWEVELINNRTKEKISIISKAIVNCAGPWVIKIIENNLKLKSDLGIRLVKGSHIVTNKIFDNEINYIFQNKDGRIIFAIPYEKDFTLIGTTDIEFHGDTDDISCSEEEKDYLINAISEYINNPLCKNDIVYSYSGVRPLFNDNKSKAQNVTRDYVIKTTDIDNKAPLVNVFGGKITTYRILAEKVLNELTPYFENLGKNWTKDSNLPGGDFNPGDFDTLLRKALNTYNFLTDNWAERIIRAYGTKIFEIYKDTENLHDLGINFGWNLTEIEVIWLIENEFVESADDILWRRSKIGLRVSIEQTQQLDKWIKSYIKKNKGKK